MVDFQGYNTSNKFLDYQRADQEFQLKRQLAAQQIQSGGIDAMTKANMYKTQLLSGAAAGGQPAYDQARATLQSQGIDTSEFAPDVETATTQLQQARLAQSPLGSLLGLGMKAEGNLNQAAGLTGNIGTAASIDPLSASIAARVAGMQGGQPAAPPQATAPSKMLTQPEQNNVVQAMTGFDNLANQNAQPAPAPSAAPAPPVPMSFNPPTQNPGETIAAYNQRVQQGFDAFKSNPDYIQQVKKSEKAGEIAATNEESAKQATEMTGRLAQNLDALEKLVPDLPSSDLIDPATKAYIGKRNPLSDKKASTAYSQFQEINQQQMINGLSELVKSGQIRGNQFIEKIISRGYMINPDDPKEAQLADIKNLKAELGNIKTSALNIAGDNKPYQPIPVKTSAPQPGTTMQGTDGIYFFNGGDPTDQNNWKKVR